MTKNQAASIRQRLLNLARERCEDFNFVLRQFVLQRLMYRLAVSEYIDDFLLKGGLLFWVWNEDFHRPTQDMDLLSFGKNDIDLVKEKFMRIVQIEVNDGLVFDTSSLKASSIKEEAKYQGIRITGKALLNRANIPFQVDIGFGDAVEEVVQTTTIPVFLSDLPAPELKVYPIESVIAEKFHAMVVLGEANSRMKDFFDIITIAETMQIESTELKSAILATFKRRETNIVDQNLNIFSKMFKDNNNKSQQWNAFKNKNGLELTDDFSETITKIQQFLEKLYRQIALGHTVQSQKWDCHSWSWQ